MIKKDDKIMKLRASSILDAEGLYCPYYAHFTITRVGKTFAEAESDNNFLYLGTIRINIKNGIPTDVGVCLYNQEKIDQLNNHYYEMLRCRKLKKKIDVYLKSNWDIEMLTKIEKLIKIEEHVK